MYVQSSPRQDPIKFMGKTKPKEIEKKHKGMCVLNGKCQCLRLGQLAKSVNIH